MTFFVALSFKTLQYQEQNKHHNTKRQQKQNIVNKLIVKNVVAAIGSTIERVFKYLIIFVILYKKDLRRNRNIFYVIVLFNV